MAHRITAGVDILLMPSRFEPCGLNQVREKWPNERMEQESSETFFEQLALLLLCRQP